MDVTSEYAKVAQQIKKSKVLTNKKNWAASV